MKPLSDDIHHIVKKIFSKQHPFLAEIIVNWGKIVGLKFSQKASPLKISRVKEKGAIINVLYIQVDNHPLSLEMSFHQDIIIERIAIYLGFKAIHKVRVIVT